MHCMEAVASSCQMPCLASFATHVAAAAAAAPGRASAKPRAQRSVCTLCTRPLRSPTSSECDTRATGEPLQ